MDVSFAYFSVESVFMVFSVRHIKKVGSRLFAFGLFAFSEDFGVIHFCYVFKTVFY